jgi:CHAT domain-containing protein
LELSVGASAFVRLRKAKPSSAPRPILAFADPAPEPDAQAQAEALQVGAERMTHGLAFVPTGAGASSAAANVCVPEAQAILDFPALPDTLDEARAAVGALGGGADDVVSGAAFTDAAVVARKDLNKYRALLFATHAALPNQARCWPDPFLITTKASDAASDGVLETAEIANLDLDADLVVLSACNTGAGDARGQALGGLAQSFIFAGSRGVVVSHWIANSRGATSLTGRMYAELGKGAAPAQALARAERAMMDDRPYSHPYYWALFTVVGGAAVAPEPNAPAVHAGL